LDIFTESQKKSPIKTCAETHEKPTIKSPPKSDDLPLDDDYMKKMNDFLQNLSQNSDLEHTLTSLTKELETVQQSLSGNREDSINNTISAADDIKETTKLHEKITSTLKNLKVNESDIVSVAMAIGNE
jgi:hypothetical protein